ncbi:MAG: hypothetical protein ACR2HR_11140 [Euzebya sp.]
MRTRFVAVLIGLCLVAMACGEEPDVVQAVTDDMDCAQVARVIEQAIERGTTYVGLEQSDAALADDLVFALSGVEERPECVPESVRSRANGLRFTITGTGG